MAAKYIGLIANLDKPGAVKLLVKLQGDLQSAGHSVLFHDAAADAISNAVPELKLEARGLSLDNLAEKSELLIILGGDGTLLKIASRLQERAKPLAAVNTGSLGFLTSVTSDETDRLVKALSDSSFEISHRRILSATLKHGDQAEQTFTALNELVISRGTTSRTVHVEARVDNQFVNHYSGDGLIVATPTGSTAYSMSAGGPIVHPQAPVLIITPVCPHALANRAIVVSDSSQIELRVADQRQPLYLTVDGQNIAELCSEASIRITRGEFELPLVTLKDASFFKVLKGKLGWYGSSVRKGG